MFWLIPAFTGVIFNVNGLYRWLKKTLFPKVEGKRQPQKQDVAQFDVKPTPEAPPSSSTERPDVPVKPTPEAPPSSTTEHPDVEVSVKAPEPQPEPVRLVNAPQKQPEEKLQEQLKEQSNGAVAVATKPELSRTLQVEEIKLFELEGVLFAALFAEPPNSFSEYWIKNIPARELGIDQLPPNLCLEKKYRVETFELQPFEVSKPE